jgi:hypothetical protein
MAALSLVGIGVWAPIARANVVSVRPITIAPLAVPGAVWRPAFLNDHGQVLTTRSQLPGEWAAWSSSAGMVNLNEMTDSLSSQSVEVFMAGLNDAGTAVGTAGVALGVYIPFSFSFATSSRTELDRGGHLNGWVTSIGSDGTIGGRLVDDGAIVPPIAASVPAVWTGASHALRVLPDLGFGGVVTSVNGNGQAVGFVMDSTGHSRPRIWDVATGSPRDLPVPTGPAVIYDEPTISDSGLILVHDGYSGGQNVVIDSTSLRVTPLDPAGHDYQAVQNAAGQIAYLDSSTNDLVITDPRAGTSVVAASAVELKYGMSLNDRGQVAYSTLSAGTLHAFVWDTYAGTIDLGDGQGQGLVLTAINDVGQAVGWDTTAFLPWIGTVLLGPQPPEQPAAAPSSGGVDISWQPPISSGDAPVTGYVIYRNGQRVAAVPANQTSTVDPSPAGPVTYTVTAMNIYGESNPAATSPLIVPSSATPTSSTAANPIPAVPMFTG